MPAEIPFVAKNYNTGFKEKVGLETGRTVPWGGCDPAERVTVQLWARARELDAQCNRTEFHLRDRAEIWQEQVPTTVQDLEVWTGKSPS